MDDLWKSQQVDEMILLKATKFDEIFNVDLTLTTYCQIDGKDFFNFCGLLRKHDLYSSKNPVLTNHRFCGFIRK